MVGAENLKFMQRTYKGGVRMDKDTARAIADINKRILEIQKSMPMELDSEKVYRGRADVDAQQTITDLDIADITSEQTITDLDLRILELEVQL